MITRDLEGARRDAFNVTVVRDYETGDALAHLPEKQSLPIPDVGEQLTLSELELVDAGEEKGQEIAPNTVEKRTFIVKERSFDYSLLTFDGNEMKDIEEGDQMYSFVYLDVTEVDPEGEELGE